MFIGHLPAGYLLTRGLFRGAPRTVMIAGLAGSVAPDLDMLWFYLVDGQSTHHHDYLTHRPMVWLAGVVLATAVRAPAGLAFALAGLLHMALDSIVGRVDWGWPLMALPVTLIEVPATRSHWILSFLTHWTILIEIAVVTTAATIAWRANTWRA